MTFREWLIHFQAWLFNFPWGKDGHCFVGIAGNGEHECLLCKRKHYDADDEYEPESSEEDERITHDYQWHEEEK